MIEENDISFIRTAERDREIEKDKLMPLVNGSQSDNFIVCVKRSDR